jgi:hypothetical protein
LSVVGPPHISHFPHHPTLTKEQEAATCNCPARQHETRRAHAHSLHSEHYLLNALQSAHLKSQSRRSDKLAHHFLIISLAGYRSVAS